MHINKYSSARRGFTLVEIMIVVAIIALLAAIAVPNFMRARKRSQATKILEDLRILSSAASQYAIDHNKNVFNWPDIKPYIKDGSVLYSAFAADGSAVYDLFNNPYCSDGTPDGSGSINVNRATFDLLSDVADAEFWSAYGIQPGS